MSNNEPAFGIFSLLKTIVLVLLLAGLGHYVYKQNAAKPKAPERVQASQPAQAVPPSEAVQIVENRPPAPEVAPAEPPAMPMQSTPVAMLDVPVKSNVKPPLPPINTPEGLAARVVKVMGRGFGTGVPIAPDKVATNCHVVRGVGKAMIKKFDSTELVATKAHLRSYRDICVLALDAPAFEADELFAMDERIAVGQVVQAVGYPGGRLSHESGVVRELRDQERAGLMIIHDAYTNRGSSGGGLFNQSGALVGINTMGTQTKAGEVLESGAMPIRLVRETVSYTPAIPLHNLPEVSQESFQKYVKQ